MHFKLIIALVEDHRTEKVMETARECGARGATVVHQASFSSLITVVQCTFLGGTGPAAQMFTP